MKRDNEGPPRLFVKLFRWYCRPDLADYIEGDLSELYSARKKTAGRRMADFRFALDVLLLFRPGIIRPLEGYGQLNTYGMYKNYLSIGWRNLMKESGYSIVNVGGLSLGIAVSLLIGLWVFDEWSFDKHQKNYNAVASVMQNNTIDGSVQTWDTQSYQLGAELRNNYGNNFRYVVMSTFPRNTIIALNEKAVMARGSFMEKDAPALLSLTMLRGRYGDLRDPSSILLSASVAKSIFGDEEPLNKTLRVDNDIDLKVTGIYEDIPDNSSFSEELGFIAHLDVIVNRGGRSLGWGNNWLQVFVEVADNVDMQAVSTLIKDVKLKNLDKSQQGFKSQLFLFPMSKWYLYSGFENGVNTGGRIEVVVLFGTVGAIVLLLACINFMNLSTARSQKRAKEIGIRKAIGTVKGQLITQFLIESFLVVSIASLIAVCVAQLLLPWFNEVAAKDIHLPWTSFLFWVILIGFIFLISLISGSYPAFYLSSFRPVSALRGTIRSGGSAARKVLVVIQFSAAVTLVICTIVVYYQIQFARSRPVGYELEGRITVPIQTKEVKQNYNALRNALLSSGLISEVSTSETTITNLWWSDTGFQWRGKDPALQDVLYRGSVSYEFGKSIGWTIKQGRDFSRSQVSDSLSIILNEAAVKYMGFEDPIGESIRQYNREYTVIGVVGDMVTQSLYQPAKPTIFILDPFGQERFINVRVADGADLTQAVDLLSREFIKFNPNTPFNYDFADREFAGKFALEARVGTLVGWFAGIAILISCLGLFGLSSFVAEQRKKEIGIRKVMGASVFGLWRLLANDFVLLVCISVIIAAPIAYYFMSIWLSRYDYRTDLSWWMFFVSGIGALMVTLITVSYQSIKTAMANPVTRLRAE